MSITVDIQRRPRTRFAIASAGPCFIALLLVGFSTSARAEDHFTEVTLQDALVAARKFSPDIANSEGAVENARAAQRTAFGEWLPRVSLNARGTYSPTTERLNPTTNTPVSGGNTSVSGGLSASYDLFTGFKRGADQRLTEAQSRAAIMGLSNTRAQLTLTVQNAFFAALRARELMDVANARKVRALQALDAAQRRLAAGSATQSDLLRAQLELNTAEQGILEQENAYRSAAFALGRFLGIENGAAPSADASEKLNVSDAPVDHAIVERLVNEAPVVKSAQAQVDSQNAQIAVARSRYYPTAGISSGYDIFNQDVLGGTGSFRTSWSVGVNLSFTIFDGFARDETVTRASVAERVARSQLDDVKRAVRAQAENAVAAVTLAQKKVGFARQAVDVAREDLRVQTERYKLGVSTMLDRLTSEANLVAAENTLISSRFDYELAKAGLEALLGDPS